MRRFRAHMAVVACLAMLYATSASAAQFSPTATFHLTTPKVNRFTGLHVQVNQDVGEEELQFVKLRIPAGFSLPSDGAIEGCTMAPGNRHCEGGDTLGNGSIDIAAGPGCHPSVSNPEATEVAEDLPATLKERDRTDSEKDDKQYAVWILEITGVTTIPLVVRGSKTKGWTLDGEIVPNDGTCPPLAFGLTIHRKSANGVNLIKTPARAARYTLSGTFEGVAGSIKTISKRITIKR